jgi:hypothetical protein
MYVPALNDRVSGTGTGLQPYTGTVSKIFVGFVRVEFDTPQGPGGIHKFALTSPSNLTLLERAKPVHVDAPTFPVEGDAPVRPFDPNLGGHHLDALSSDQAE